MIKQIKAFGNNYLAAIFTLLILFSGFQSHSQIAMFHAHNQPPGDLLFDIYPGAYAGYSFRKLDKDYNGFCIRVRRTSDNVTQDIGFVNNYIDTNSLKSFIGASSGAVQIWYNQADSSGVFGKRNLSAFAGTAEPNVMTSGSINYKDGHVSALFTTNILASNQILNTTITASNVIMALSINSGSTNGRFYTQTTAAGQDFSVSNHYIPIISSSSAVNYGSFAASGFRSTIAHNGTSLQILQSVHSGSSITNYVNTTAASSYAHTLNLVVNSHALGARFTSVADYGNGNYLEVLVYHTTGSSSDIKTAVNTYYTIY